MINKQKGFSMIEMIIVIGIIAILASLITPLAVNYITQKRYNVCNEELEIIKQAIVGDQTLVEGGTRSSFGFVGDMGRLPATLSELTTIGTNPPWQQALNVWFGWRGPYVSEIKDPWGNEYFIHFAWTEKSGTEFAMIESYGQDGINNPPTPIDGDDDVSIIIRFDEAFSMVSGNTLDTCGAGAAFTNIEVFYPVLASVTSTAPPQLDTLLTSPHYNIQTAIPIGIRYISVGTPVMNKLIYINNGPLTIVNLRTPGVCN